MKNRTAALIFVFAISTPVLARSQDVQLPDYTKWEDISTQAPLSAVLDGESVRLGFETYRTTDNVALRWQIVNVVYNRQDKPWFAVYGIELGEKQQDGTVQVKESRTYLFENRNGKWVEVWRDANEFLRQNYKLEFK